MKILLVSDIEETYIWDYFDRERFKDIDLVISCGDLKAEYLSFLVTMIPTPLYYVPGNHNGTYLANPPEGCESIDGKLITYNGIRILGLGGSQRYNMGPYQYTEKEMQSRIRKLRYVINKNRGFDVLVSHAPAFALGDGKDLCHRGFKSFIHLLDKYSPKYFFYGHKHLISNLELRITQYKKTKVINAYGYYILDY